ncbi:MAG: hypothetical protein WC749_02400 [Dehalococcoidia bacterium]
MSKKAKPDFQSDETSRRIDGYLTQIEQNRSHMDENYTEWEACQTAYSGDQELQDGRPNSRVNIINANVEGQVCALVEQNLAVMCRGEGPSDKPFAKYAQVMLDWTLRKNHIKRKLRTHEYRRELFGTAYLKVGWDKDAVNGFGLATITCPPLNSVFVDMKITDEENLQDADYIAEVMLRSKTWAGRQDEYQGRAEYIKYGGTDKAPIFTKEKTTDDEDAFWLIQRWSFNEGNLRLEEFSDCGVLLYDSHEDDTEPFYRYNKYPYFLTNLYIVEGELYGFGDGKLLRPLQDMLNNLYDQIRITARPNRIFFDPASEVELEDWDETDDPIPCNDPNTNIRVVECGRVNPALWQLVDSIHREVQRVTRYSELMLGQSMKARTATEAAIQQQQGSGATDHKKLMLQETLIDVCYYLADLIMENCTEGRYFAIDEDKEDYQWVDPRQLNQVPVLVPPNSAFEKGHKENNPNPDPAKWMQLEDEEGNPVTKLIDLDLDINLGAGLPHNKAFLWQMVETLSRIMSNGMPIVTLEEMRKFAKDYLGLPLDDTTPMMPGQPPGMPGQMPGVPGQQTPMMQSPMAGGMGPGVQLPPQAMQSRGGGGM